MYFLWERTSNGTLRVSREGLAEFIGAFLAARARLEGLALASMASPAEEARVTLVLDTQDSRCAPRLEGRLSALLRPMGLLSSVVWIDRGDPYSEWAEMRLALLRTPWFWTALSASAALVAVAGWGGFFWTAFWGTTAWFTAKALSFLLRGRRFPIQTSTGRR